MLTKEKLSKLPKWAQEEISSLGRKVTALTRELEQALGQHPESNTYVHLDWPKKIFVENYSRVVFQGNGMEATVHVHPDGFIRIEFDDAVIAPCGRNCIHLLDNKNKGGR